MSEQNGDARERATLALAVAEVRGLRDLMRAEFGAVGKEFGAVQRQLDAVSGLPAALARLEERTKALEDTVEDLHADNRLMRRGISASMAAVMVTAVGTAIAMFTKFGGGLL